MATDSVLEKRLECDESVRIKGVDLRENCVRAFFFPGTKNEVSSSKSTMSLSSRKSTKRFDKNQLFIIKQPNLAIQ